MRWRREEKRTINLHMALTQKTMSFMIEITYRRANYYIDRLNDTLQAMADP
jgi:hypothetical protein